MTSDQLIAENIAAIRARIRSAETISARQNGSVALMAVSKTRSAAEIAAAAAAGAIDIGENYLQEALDKQAQLSSLALCWHFIGPIQSNKTRAIAEQFDWVHSVDRLKIARRLSEQRPPALPPLQICLQVNINAEDSKSGLLPSELVDVAAEVTTLPGLSLRGLMAIPRQTDDPAVQRSNFAQVRSLFKTLQVRLPDQPLDTLSMGMSADMEAAIMEGATIVRIGSDIFGPRAQGAG